MSLLSEMHYSHQNRHIREFLSSADPTWGEGAAVRENARTIAHIRNPCARDEFATAGLPAEINFLEAPRDQPPLFVSCYTEHTPYETLAVELRASLDRLGLSHRLEPVASRGSWAANTGLKADALLRAWNEYDRPICWIDADAELLRRPYVVFDNPFDVAIVRRHGWYDMSGFVYFGNTDAARAVLVAWAALCHEYPFIWDQVLFTLAWYRVASSTALSTLWLHQGFFRWPRPRVRDWRDQMFHYPLKRKVRPFIAQKQASRHFKKLVDNPTRRRRELGSDDVAARFRTALRHYDFSLDARPEAILNGLGTQ